MDGDGDGGGYDGGGDDYSVRSPGYNDNCRDDLPFEPVNRNNDPFKSAEDPEEKYRLERERVAVLKETDVDEIRPCDDDDNDVDRTSTDGRHTGGLAVMLGGSLANSVIEGLADKNDGMPNGKTPYTTFGISDRERRSSDGNCAQDCVYYSVLCCQCSIL